MKLPKNWTPGKPIYPRSSFLVPFVQSDFDPTLGEIASATNEPSKSTVNYHLRRLLKTGELAQRTEGGGYHLPTTNLAKWIERIVYLFGKNGTDNLGDLIKLLQEQHDKEQDS